MTVFSALERKKEMSEEITEFVLIYILRCSETNLIISLKFFRLKVVYFKVIYFVRAKKDLQFSNVTFYKNVTEQYFPVVIFLCYTRCFRFQHLSLLMKS